MWKSSRTVVVIISTTKRLQCSWLAFSYAVSHRSFLLEEELDQFFSNHSQRCGKDPTNIRGYSKRPVVWNGFISLILCANFVCTDIAICELQKQSSQMFFKIRVLKNFTIFTGKHLCWSHFLILVYQLFNWSPLH